MNNTSYFLDTSKQSQLNIKQSQEGRFKSMGGNPVNPQVSLQKQAAAEAATVSNQ